MVYERFAIEGNRVQTPGLDGDQWPRSWQEFLMRQPQTLSANLHHMMHSIGCVSWLPNLMIWMHGFLHGHPSRNPFLFSRPSTLIASCMHRIPYMGHKTWKRNATKHVNVIICMNERNKLEYAWHAAHSINLDTKIYGATTRNMLTCSHAKWFFYYNLILYYISATNLDLEHQAKISMHDPWQTTMWKA